VEGNSWTKSQNLLKNFRQVLLLYEKLFRRKISEVKMAAIFAKPLRYQNRNLCCFLFVSFLVQMYVYIFVCVYFCQSLLLSVYISVSLYFCLCIFLHANKFSSQEGHFLTFFYYIIKQEILKIKVLYDSIHFLHFSYNFHALWPNIL